MKTALVVDDEDVMRDYFSAVLESLGLRVLTADDGETAIQVMKQNPNIDLIILDLKMKTMGGQEAYPHLKNINPRAKVLISSAFIDGETESKLLEMGIDAILKKPFPLLSFKATVLELLEENS
jgi:CheY-like chemotaxis protein